MTVVAAAEMIRATPRREDQRSHTRSGGGTLRTLGSRWAKQERAALTLQREDFRVGRLCEGVFGLSSVISFSTRTVRSNEANAFSTRSRSNCA